MQARLSLDILNKGDQSLFVRTGRGAFYLREFLADPVPLVDELGVATPTRPTPYAAPRRAPMRATECVLAIPRSHYESLLTFQGLKCDEGALAQGREGVPVYESRCMAVGHSDE
jgi:hypothetical protein